MTAALFGVLTGLALADSLNPFTVAAQAYLLGTPRPMPRSVAFLLGTYATYLLGGLVLLEGWTLVLQRIAPLVPWWGLGAGELALGLATVAFGIWSLRKARAGVAFTPPAQLSIGATLVFAVASTVSDLPTALPYFAAVNRVAAEIDGLPRQLVAVGWYDLVYCAPMIALIVARTLLSAERSELLFGRLRSAVDWAFAKLLPPVLLLTGVALLVDGGRRLLAP